MQYQHLAGGGQNNDVFMGLFITAMAISAAYGSLPKDVTRRNTENDALCVPMLFFACAFVRAARKRPDRRTFERRHRGVFTPFFVIDVSKHV